MELLTLKDDDEIYTTIVKEHLNQRKVILRNWVLYFMVIF